MSDDLARAVSREWDRRFIAAMPVLMPEQQAEARATHQRQQRERAERIAAEKQARADRYAAVLARTTGVLAQVVAHHAPTDNAGWGDCVGCDQYGDDSAPADWPCSTFLMVEKETA